MKKATPNVLLRALSLVLVTALLFTSVISSLSFTASAEDSATETYYKEVIDFDGDDPSDGVTLGNSNVFAYEQCDGLGGGYALHRKYGSTSAENVVFNNISLTKGKTYLFKYDYYIPKPTEEGVSYNTWNVLCVGNDSGTQVINGGTVESYYGSRQTLSRVYTATQDYSCISLWVSNVDIYFDNITVIDYEEYLNSISDTVYEEDFSKYTSSADVPLIASTKGFSLVEDEDGINTVRASYNGQGVFVPMKLKANTSYTVTVKYKTTAGVWGCPYFNVAPDNNNGLSSSGSLRTKTFTFTNNTNTLDSTGCLAGGYVGFWSNTTDSSAVIDIYYIKVAEVFDISVGTAENGSATVSASSAAYGDKVTFTAKPDSGYYLDYWTDADGKKVSENAVWEYTVTEAVTLTPVFAKDENSAERQAYDFDKLIPTVSGYSAVVAVEGRNGNTTNALKVTNSSGTNKDHYVTLSHTLTAGKQYKLSYDYKGKGIVGAWICVNNYKDAQNTELGWDLNSHGYYDSEVWQRHETVFTASGDLTKLYFFTPSWKVYDTTNGDTVYFDNIVIEEYTPGFDSYETDFDDGELLPGAALKNTVATVKVDPADKDGKCVALYASGYTAYDLSGYRMQEGHTYILAMDVYSPAAEAHLFRLDIKNGDGTYYKEELAWITAQPGEWLNVYRSYAATEDNQLISFFVNAEVYIDNFKLIDVTNDKGYHEDFEKPDSITLLDSVAAELEYEYDEELGKNVAVITYPTSANIDNNKIIVPYRLKDGVQYRVRVKYTATNWFCPSFNGKVQGNDGPNGAGYKTSYVTQDWYVTGSGDNDYFGFTSNQSDAVLKIAEITIEIMSGIAGDMDNDGKLSATDLALLKKNLLGIYDADSFVEAGDIVEDGNIDLLDFIRLKRLIAGLVSVSDDASEVNAVTYAAENVTTDKTSAALLGDESTFRTAVAGKDAYVIYKLDNSITEAAVEYDTAVSFRGDFTFEVSFDGKTFSEITSGNITREQINSDSWIRTTEYFGNLRYASYLKISFPSVSEGGESSARIRTVRINGLNNDALYAMHGCNADLRELQTFYVSSSGSDSNNGLSEDKPLRTLSAAFERVLVPGDKILLKKGDTFSGSVKILSSGTERNPITVGSYGTGEKPIIADFENAAITVTGEYVEIDGLAFTSPSGNAGIHFYALKDAEKYGANRGISVTNCEFYKINSEKETGTDSRSSGGVHFMAMGNKPAWFDGITVKSNSFKTVARNSVLVSSNWSARDVTQTWGNNNLKLDGKPVYMSKNILIAENSIENNGGDAITLIGTDGAVIEYNTVANSALLYNNNYKTYTDEDGNTQYVIDSDGNKVNSNIAYAAIWCHSSDNCVMQYNEVYGNRDTNSAQDLQAFDIDIACRNCIVQYNYSHDNDGGFMLLCALDSADNAGVSGAIVRYNLSVNDGKSGLNVFDITGSVSDSKIYNNTVYCGNNDVKLVNFSNYGKATVKSSGNLFCNNIFCAAEGVTVSWGYGDSVTKPALQSAEFKNNLFRNIAEPAYNDLINVSGTLTDDPQFANEGLEENGRQTGKAYIVGNSDILNKGITVDGNGGRDYFGNAISADSTLIGAVLE